MANMLRRSLAGLLVGLCVSAAAQPNVPIAFQKLDEGALAEACFYEMQVSSYVSYVLWDSTRDDLHREQMIQAALAAQLWRGKATKVSAGGMEQALRKMRMRSESDRHAQIRYCGDVAASSIAVLTRAQRERLANRTRERLYLLRDGMRAE